MFRDERNVVFLSRIVAQNRLKSPKLDLSFEKTLVADLKSSGKFSMIGCAVAVFSAVMNPVAPVMKTDSRMFQQSPHQIRARSRNTNRAELH